MTNRTTAESVRRHLYLAGGAHVIIRVLARLIDRSESSTGQACRALLAAGEVSRIRQWHEQGWGLRRGGYQWAYGFKQGGADD